MIMHPSMTPEAGSAPDPHNAFDGVAVLYLMREEMKQFWGKDYKHQISDAMQQLRDVMRVDHKSALAATAAVIKALCMIPEPPVVDPKFHGMLKKLVMAAGCELAEDELKDDIRGRKDKRDAGEGIWVPK